MFCNFISDALLIQEATKKKNRTQEFKQTKRKKKEDKELKK